MKYESQYYGVVNPESSLTHHGIKGQKWGVRRFQNIDGSLTRAGIERYQKSSVKLKRGTKLSRYANDEPLDSKRKYVSLTGSDDQAEYELNAIEGGLYAKKNQPIYQYTYELSKNINVASDKEVTDHILEKYGNSTIHEIASMKAFPSIVQNGKLIFDGRSYYNEVKNIPLNKIWKPTDPKGTDYKALSINDVFIKLLRDDIMMYKTRQSEVFNEFASRGYDAIIDIEDKLVGYNMPIIVMRPDITMKLKSKKKI